MSPFQPPAAWRLLISVRPLILDFVFAYSPFFTLCFAFLTKIKSKKQNTKKKKSSKTDDSRFQRVKTNRAKARKAESKNYEKYSLERSEREKERERENILVKWDGLKLVSVLCVSVLCLLIA